MSTLALPAAGAPAAPVPRSEFTLPDRRPCVAHQPLVEKEIVQRRESQSKNLLHLEEMAQVRPREMAARVTSAFGIDGPAVETVPRVRDIHPAVRCEEHRVPAVARRKDAVEHVDAPLDRFEQVLRSSHPHEIPGLLLRQYLSAT